MVAEAVDLPMQVVTCDPATLLPKPVYDKLFQTDVVFPNCVPQCDRNSGDRTTLSGICETYGAKIAVREVMLEAPGLGYGGSVRHQQVDTWQANKSMKRICGVILRCGSSGSAEACKSRAIS